MPTVIYVCLKIINLPQLCPLHPIAFNFVFLFYRWTDLKKVYTFVGPPKAVVEAALAAAFKAYELIDMARHKGNIWIKKQTGITKIDYFYKNRRTPSNGRVRCLSVYSGSGKKYEFIKKKRKATAGFWSRFF